MKGLELIVSKGREAGKEVIALSDPLIAEQSNYIKIVTMQKEDGQLQTYNIDDLKIKEFKEG